MIPPTLLYVEQNPRSRAAYDFDHAMTHRAAARLLPQATSPVVFDPSYQTGVRATAWHQDHQQNHDTFTLAVASLYNVPVALPAPIPLMDSSLDEAASRTWWTFANFQAHFIINGQTP